MMDIKRNIKRVTIWLVLLCVVPIVYVINPIVSLLILAILLWLFTFEVYTLHKKAIDITYREGKIKRGKLDINAAKDKLKKESFMDKNWAKADKKQKD